VSGDRIAALRALLEKRPHDARVRFGLAAAYEAGGQWEEAVTELRAYLRGADDEGNAWGRLGRTTEARDAYTRGVEAATRHGHPSMAAEFTDLLSQLD
jgi:E3 SUMO-protein ligase RanBP2